MKDPSSKYTLLSRLLLCAVLILCSSAIAARAQGSTDPGVAKVSDLLTRYDEALNNHDLDGIMKTFDPGPKTVIMGTGPGEKYQGTVEIREAFSHIFDDFDKGSVKRDCYWKTGDVRGNTAWVDAMCKFSDSKGGKPRDYELNVSGVAVKNGDQWYFQSLHYSNVTGGK
jgi:ketosteroid isomerase-like protein